MTTTRSGGGSRVRRVGVSRWRSICLRGALLAGALIAGPTTAAPAASQDALLTEEVAATIEAMVIEKMAADRIPGLSIAVAVDGRLAWSRGFGMADLENFVPATATTAYRTASIGKPMTATAIMQLVERGQIDLDAPVQRYCPAFPEKRWPVTTRHLLAHTSGIRHYGGPNEEEELFNTVHYESVVEALDIFKADPLLFEPGTDFLYSTFGYNTLGCVVEGAAGQDFRSYMQEHVFGPAGMVGTRDDDPAALIPRRAEGYVYGEGGDLRNSRSVDMSSKLPAGGFVTTAEDLVRFAIAVMQGTLIRRATFEQMISPVRLADGEVVEQGLGWGLFPGERWYGEREAFHGGMTPTVSAMLYLLPDRQFAVALLTNLEGVSGRTQLAAEIAKEVLDLAADPEP